MRTDERVAELEEELRHLRGQLRECEQECTDLDERIDQLVSDYHDLHQDYLDALVFTEYVDNTFPEARVAFEVAQRVS